jgi:Peptidase family M28
MLPRISRRFCALAPYLFCIPSCLTTHFLWAQKVSIVFQAVPVEVVAQRMHRLHLKNAEREAELKAMFAEAGCGENHLEEEIVKRKDPPNVICTLPGSTNSLIILGAHLDHAEEGVGAVDDWSGASLLPSVYEALAHTPRKHTFVFIGFTDEETGLGGSRYYVRHFPKEQLSTIKAVVNLECLGLAPTEVWSDVANKTLLAALANVAQSMHLTLKGVNVERVADDDTHPFRDKKLPVITLHSVTQETLPILHSARDNLAAVKLENLYNSYRLVSGYLVYLDAVLD